MNAHPMKMIGSGAAEAVPNPMCRCAICANARKQGGKDIRSRSCFRVSEAVQIDFGPDQFYQSTVLGNDLTTVTDLLITHTHADHLALADLGLRQMAVEVSETPVTLYASHAGCAWIRQALAACGGSDLLDERLYRLLPVAYCEPVSVAGLNVTPLKGNHRGNGPDEFSVNYLIALENGKTLYYATDTGYFLEETFEFLRNVKLDCLIVEGTFGDAPGFREAKTNGHMGCAGVLAVTERLLEQRTLHADSRVVVTHINHKHTLTHARMQAFFDAHRPGVPISVGHDGMEILL